MGSYPPSGSFIRRSVRLANPGRSGALPNEGKVPEAPTQFKEKNMPVTKEDYQDALDVLHEVLPMQLQRQDPDTGEWKNVGSCVRGQKAGYA